MGSCPFMMTFNSSATLINIYPFISTWLYKNPYYLTISSPQLTITSVYKQLEWKQKVINGRGCSYIVFKQCLVHQLFNRKFLKQYELQVKQQTSCEPKQQQQQNSNSFIKY